LSGNHNNYPQMTQVLSAIHSYLIPILNRDTFSNCYLESNLKVNLASSRPPPLSILHRNQFPQQ
ncbi:MAG: hypothetical protein KIG81_09210, partial [Thermoguttaceae bacterium]|nr:hypothetical protein [Thermoguttaceae bacterium]